MTPPSEENPELLSAFSFEELRFKEIEVKSQGISYQGILIGADSSDIYIKGRLRWIILPMDQVSTVKLKGKNKGLDLKKIISKGFYDTENDG